MIADIKGTGVALVTPFKNNEIDFQSLERVVNHVVKGGTDFLVALGSTGETPTLSTKEQIEVVQFVAEKVENKIPMVVGLTGSSTAELIERSALFPMDKIDAILTASPPYNKPTQEGIFQHYSALATAIEKPFIIYNVPGRTAGNISPETTLRLAESGLPFIATKEASGSLDQIMDIIRSKPNEFLVLSGDDNLTLPIISVGGQGVISVIANALPFFYNHMVQHALNYSLEEAQELHYNMLPIIRLIFREGNPAGIKALLNIMGICQPDVRMPLIPASKELHRELEKALKKFGADNGS